MDFQSAARFGERRVMVTDYDETAVEVNAKVVDEDTGEVICECESGGVGGDLISAIVTVTSDSTAPLSLLEQLKNAETVDPLLSGYIIVNESAPISPGTNANVLVPNNGQNFPIFNRTIEVIEGDATVTELTGEEGTYYALKISGNCTVKVTAIQ